MYARGQTLLVRNAPEQDPELAALVFSERGEERLLVFPTYASDRLQTRSSLLREVQGVATAILGILATLDQSAGFEFVH
jgi:hypothetical protein